MTDEQKQAQREMEQVFEAISTEFADKTDMPEILDMDAGQFQSMILGSALAVTDALLAIREGTEWRGMTDPKDIAGDLLRQMGL